MRQRYEFFIGWQKHAKYQLQNRLPNCKKHLPIKMGRNFDIVVNNQA